MKILIVLLFMISSNLLAHGLKVAVGLSIPPYVIKETNSGFEVELMQKVLASKGYNVTEFIYASNKRITKLLKSKKVDMALNLQPNLKNIFYSDILVEFNNVAITLKNRDITIKSLFDLHDKRVFAFQNAHKFLGKEFATYAKNNTLYEETIHQLSQVKHLLQKRVDVVVADKHIFLYYLKKSKYDNNTPLNFFNIFSSSPRYLGFIDKKIQKDFDDALKSFKLTKAYEELFIKYNLPYNAMDK